MGRHGLRPLAMEKMLCKDALQAAVKKYAQAVRPASSWTSVLVPRQFILHEYACFEDSLLGKEAQKQGWQVRQWGLHNVDLTMRSGVERVAQCIRDDLAKGGEVCLWISLPCSAWSPLNNLGV